MKIAILSNVNLDLLVKVMEKQHTVFAAEGYGQWISYALEPNSQLSLFGPRTIFLILDGNALLERCSCYEEGRKELQRCADYVREFANHYKESSIAVSTIDIPLRHIRPVAEAGTEALWEADWVRELSALSLEAENVLTFDLKNLISEQGRSSVYSEKMWYMGSIPYGNRFISVLAEAMEQMLGQLVTVRKKILVIDLDNTIWGGVAGEDGPEGVILGESLLGAAYRDAQKRIQEIKETGILLAVVSKNNPDDVRAVFEKNAFMVLKKEDFVSIIANWEPKPQNIQELAVDLNLGLDAFVFLDDNELEREAVRTRLPEVTVVKFPPDAARLPKVIESLYQEYFWCRHKTREDAEKTSQYQQETLRKQEMRSAASLEDYLLSLDMHIIMGEVRDEQVDRAVQLLNKTNQFNTNTLRMDPGQFSHYRETSGCHVYTVSVSDRYGNNGLVVELLLRVEGETAYVDNFLMSCRVMGRQIENAVIAAVTEHLFEMGVCCLCASYSPSGKNKPVEDLWDRLGFSLSEESGNGKQYEMSLPAQIDTLLHVEWEL